jgi:hypothetical protein
VRVEARVRDGHVHKRRIPPFADGQPVLLRGRQTAEVGYVSGYTGDFRNLDEATRIRKYNPEKHVILRLEFVKNKQYFVEGYQAISIRNPDATAMDMSLDELRRITSSNRSRADQPNL